MRLMDAEVICEKLAERAMEYLNVDECTVETIKEDMKIVNRIPTMEAEPVRHGRWAWTQEVCEDNYSLNCSSCGSPCPGDYDDEDETYRYHRYHYCPNCGCKMDLEE